MNARGILATALWVCLCLAATAFGAESHGEQAGSPLVGLLLSCVNFGIFLGIFFYFAWPLITSALTERRRLVVRELSEADEAHRQAAAMLAEVKERRAKVQQEGERLLRELRAAAESERVKLVDGARKTAERMASDARLVVEQEAVRAAARIREQVAEQVIARVTAAVRERLTDADQERYVGEFARAVESGELR
jgi:F-type H+-transporting ATPase subunit b